MDETTTPSEGCSESQTQPRRKATLPASRARKSQRLPRANNEQKQVRGERLSLDTRRPTTQSSVAETRHLTTSRKAAPPTGSERWRLVRHTKKGGDNRSRGTEQRARNTAITSKRPTDRLAKRHACGRHAQAAHARGGPKKVTQPPFDNPSWSLLTRRMFAFWPGCNGDAFTVMAFLSLSLSLLLPAAFITVFNGHSSPLCRFVSDARGFRGMLMPGSVPAGRTQPWRQGRADPPSHPPLAGAPSTTTNGIKLGAFLTHPRGMQSLQRRTICQPR